MQVAFRTDASLEIGTGHVMRCLTLADALSKHGAQCTFICREHVGNLLAFIRQCGYEAVALPSSTFNDPVLCEPSHAAWLGADWALDADQTLQVLGENVVDLLVVDHYALDRNWEAALRPNARRIMVIDDLAERPHDCDLLLDQNLGRSECDYANLVAENTTILIGPQFALLRPEFSAWRNQSLSRRVNNPKLRRLLITMGGVDKDNFTGHVLNALTTCDLPQDLCITVVMGINAPWIKQVQTQVANMSCPAEVLVGVNNMAQLMAESDLAIGAAGGTAWERCCLGLPSFILVLAENQRAGAISLQDAGAASFLIPPQNAPQALGNWLSKGLSDSNLLKMSLHAANVCDGAGVKRVLIKLLNQELVARPVTRADEMLLFIWVNDTLTRQNALCTDQITLADHQVWLARRLANPKDCAMFIVEREHVPIGQVRLDRGDGDLWVIDYSVAPEFRGQKLGAAVLHCVLSAFFATKREVRIQAVVRRSNLASCRVFELLCFNRHKVESDVIVYGKVL